MTVPESASMTAVTTPTWTRPERLLFRLVGTYLLLYILGAGHWRIPLPPGVSQLVDFAGGQYDRIEAWTTGWTVTHVLRITGDEWQSMGKGDSTVAWIALAWYVALAAAATIVWTALDRKRAGHPALHAWLRRLVRLTLGCTMCAYGLWKVLQYGQFFPPTLHRLLTPVGDLTPMGLMWTFMGSSHSYKAFTGSAELIGGLLLFPRRTTTLGALIVIGVMSNVTMMNFSYDVAVKGPAMTLLLMAIFLVVPDLRRMIDVFVLDRPTAGRRTSPPFTRPRWNTIATWGKSAYVMFALFALTRATLGLASQGPEGDGPSSAFRGIYDVEDFTRAGAVLPPLLSDSTRWRRIAIERSGAATVWLMNDEQLSYLTMADSARGRLTVAAPPVDPSRPSRLAEEVFRVEEATRRIAELSDKDPARISDLSYTRPDANHVLLAGRLGRDSVAIRLRRQDDSRLLLLRWHSHVVNDLSVFANMLESPYDGVPADPRNPAERTVDVPRVIDLRRVYGR